MSEIVQNVKFPLDDDGFFRRKCPLCGNDFKVLFKNEELADLTHIDTDSYMLDAQETPELENLNENLKAEYFCPYCSQKSAVDKYWTQEQVAYINVFLENIMAQIINKKLINPMKKSFKKAKSEPISIQFTGNELNHKEPWISPEVNDMDIFELPCCDRKIKVKDDWLNTIYCFFCGFPYLS